MWFKIGKGEDMLFKCIIATMNTVTAEGMMRRKDDQFITVTADDITQLRQYIVFCFTVAGGFLARFSKREQPPFCIHDNECDIFIQLYFFRTGATILWKEVYVR